MRAWLFKLPSPALVLAVVAIVLALGGVAFAATGQLVNIVDPTNSSYAAKVSSGGELRVASRSQAAPAATPLRQSYYVSQNTAPAFFGPTTATLAIDHFIGRNPAPNRSYPNSDWVVLIIRTASSGGVCNDFGTTVASYGLSVGITHTDDWATPMSFKPVGGAPYCIAVGVYPDASTSPGSYYLPQITLQGQVLSGTYTGPGAASATDRTTVNPFHAEGEPVSGPIPA